MITTQRVVVDVIIIVGVDCGNGFRCTVAYVVDVDDDVVVTHPSISTY